MCIIVCVSMSVSHKHAHFVCVCVCQYVLTAAKLVRARPSKIPDYGHRSLPPLLPFLASTHMSHNLKFPTSNSSSPLKVTSSPDYVNLTQGLTTQVITTAILSANYLTQVCTQGV